MAFPNRNVDLDPVSQTSQVSSDEDSGCDQSLYPGHTEEEEGTDSTLDYQRGSMSMSGYDDSVGVRMQDLGLSLTISEGEESIEDLQKRPAGVKQRVTGLPNEFKSLHVAASVGAVTYGSDSAVLIQAVHFELDSRCCPDNSVPSGEDLPPFFEPPGGAVGELVCSTGSEGQQSPINILERYTHRSVYHSLWWNNSMLLTGAPDFCEAAALFNITFVDSYTEGFIVQLVSLLKHKLLCADCTAKEPVFVLLSEMESSRPAIQRQYRLGPGNSQYKSFHFQHPSTKVWYYWLIEGETVVLRKQSYVHSQQLDVQLFFTKAGPECK